MPTSALPRSQLHRLTDPNAFWWAAGIEDSFITAPWPATGRTLDEYEVTDHYERFREDIGLMAHLGVSAARYGIPWHRINPAPGVWNWDWSERALDCLLENNIAPIVDLVHYGVPDWIEGAFVNPDFAARMAEYSFRAAEKFRGRIHWWTPLNEPRITAWFCGKTGTWPPYKRGWRGFVQVLAALCQGITQSSAALRQADSENVLFHVDAANNWLAPQPDEPLLREATAFRESLVFLALDLIAGRVDDEHALRPWLHKQGLPASTCDWFRERPTSLDIIGINLYPMLSQKQFVRTASGRVRIRFPYGGSGMLERIVESYWKRYKRPMMIAETAGRGRVTRRAQWLRDSVRGVRNLRERGVPLVGYTWWPLFDLVSWSYRQSQAPLRNFLVPMGLWELDHATLERRTTSLVDDYRALAQAESAPVGELMLREEH